MSSDTHTYFLMFLLTLELVKDCTECSANSYRRLREVPPVHGVSGGSFLEAKDSTGKPDAWLFCFSPPRFGFYSVHGQRDLDCFEINVTGFRRNTKLFSRMSPRLGIGRAASVFVSVSMSIKLFSIVSGCVSPGVARSPCCLRKATGQGQQQLVNSQWKEQGDISGRRLRGSVCKPRGWEI